MEEYKPKISPVSLIIGIICGLLIIGITFGVIYAIKESEKEKNPAKSIRNTVSVTLSERTSVSTQRNFNEVYSEAEESSSAPTSVQSEPSTQNTAKPEGPKNPEGPKPVNITSELQYDLNIFMSNFSESRLPNFSLGGRLSDAELIEFSESYNLLNRSDLYEYGDYSDMATNCSPNARISKEYIVDSIEKYFDVSPDESKMNDYYYLEITGGHIPQGVSIVDKADKIGENLYRVSFKVYFTGGMDNKYYSFTPDKAEKTCANAQNSYSEIFGFAKSGTAIIYATDINDRSTYILKEYQSHDC